MTQPILRSVPFLIKKCCISPHNHQKMSAQVERVLLTGASGQIGYSLIPLICGGDVCGKDKQIELVLLEIPQGMDALKGVVMEIHDSAYPLLNSVTMTSNVEEAFVGVTVALMIGGFPRLQGMNRSDLLYKNAEIFVAAGKALEKVGRKDIRVLVVANPANTNCYIMQQQCPSIPAENFTALTRLDHNRAVSQIAVKLNVTPRQVKQLAIWGNHSNTMVVDATNVVVDGAKADLDAEWVEKDFTPTVQNRGAAVIAARGKSSALSAANAAANHMNNWFNGVPHGDFTSVSLPSNGEYGIAKGLVYSFPCVSKDGKWVVVEGLELTDDMKAKLKVTEQELASERDIFQKWYAEKHSQ